MFSSLKPLIFVATALFLGWWLIRLEVEAGTFDGHPEKRRVFRAYFQEREQVYELAAWREPWDVDYEAGFVVLDASAGEAEQLRAARFRLEVDLARTLSLWRPPKRLPEQSAGIPEYACYRTVEETFAAAEQLAGAYPELATWIDAGDSWEKAAGGDVGYDMHILRLTNTARPGPKPGLFVMSSLHAREYAPAELNLRFAEYLLAQYGVDADVTWLLDYHAIHLLLQANPDGRKYAESGLLWRKNVNENYCSPDSAFRGADLNRNFPFQWGCCDGSSTDTCSEIYRGPSPASEPETRAVTDYVKANFPDQRLPELAAAAPLTATGVFLDVHSYGEWVLWPWGFSFEPAPNGEALTTLGRRLAYFNDYFPSQASGLYPTDGATDDFAYGELGLAAYTFEVGTAFFQDCASFENDIWPRNLPALLYAARVARGPYHLPSGPVVRAPALSPISGTTSFTLTATVDDGRYSSRNGAEPVQSVAAARFFVDVPPWAPEANPSPLTVVDGAFDEPVEAVSASLDAEGLANGRHIIFIEGEDADGNRGAVSALFLEVAPAMEEAVYLPVLGK